MNISVPPILREQRLKLQNEVCRRLGERNVSRKELAEELELLEVGVEIFMDRNWTYEEILTVAHKWDMKIMFTVTER